MIRRIRRLLLYLFSLFVLFLLQISLPVFMPFTALKPNLLLILVSAFGLLRGERTGLLLGFLSGLLIDLLFGDVVGLYALIYMFLGFIVGTFYKSFATNRILLSVSLIGAADVFYGFVCYVFLFLLRGRFHFGYYLWHVILPEAVFTMTIAVLLYPLFLKINDLLEERELMRTRRFV